MDSLPGEPHKKPKNAGVGIPSPADFPDPRIELGSPALQMDSLPTKLSGKPKFCIDTMKKCEQLVFVESVIYFEYLLYSVLLSTKKKISKSLIFSSILHDY